MKLSDIKNESLTSFFANFQKFMNSKTKNLWIESDNGVIRCYVRKAFHRIDNELKNTLDIANIDVAKEYQNRGIGSAVINKLHELNPFTITYVESILNPDLYKRLISQGWIDTNTDPPCLYKETGKSNAQVQTQR